MRLRFVYHDPVVRSSVEFGGEDAAQVMAALADIAGVIAAEMFTTREALEACCRRIPEEVFPGSVLRHWLERAEQQPLHHSAFFEIRRVWYLGITWVWNGEKERRQAIAQEATHD